MRFKETCKKNKKGLLPLWVSCEIHDVLVVAITDCESVRVGFVLTYSIMFSPIPSMCLIHHLTFSYYI